MAGASLARESKVESLFLAPSDVLVDSESAYSSDDNLDTHESITQKLRSLLDSYNLGQRAQTLCQSVKRMTSAEYHTPPAEGATYSITGVAGQPFWWDLFGHFKHQSFCLALSLLNKMGRHQIQIEYSTISR